MGALLQCDLISFEALKGFSVLGLLSVGYNALSPVSFFSLSTCINTSGTSGWSDVYHQCEPLSDGSNTTQSMAMSVLVQAWSLCNLPRPDFISKPHIVTQQGK